MASIEGMKTQKELAPKLQSVLDAVEQGVKNASRLLFVSRSAPVALDELIAELRCEPPSEAAFRASSLAGAESITPATPLLPRRPLRESLPRPRAVSLLRQLAVHELLVQMKDNVFDVNLDAWLEWMQTEVVHWYEAAVLEVIAHGELSGQVAEDSFLNTFALVRSSYGLTDRESLSSRTIIPEVAPIDVARVHFFSTGDDSPSAQSSPPRLGRAMRTLEENVGDHASPGFRRDGRSVAGLDLRAFVGEYPQIIASVREILSRGQSIGWWIFCLRAAVEDLALVPEYADQREAFKEALMTPPTAERGWFLAPDRLFEILETLDDIDALDGGDLAGRSVALTKLQGAAEEYAELLTDLIQPKSLEDRHVVSALIEDMWWRAAVVATTNDDDAGEAARAAVLEGGRQALVDGEIESPKVPVVKATIRRDAQRSDLTAVVFGAGIAGLTAAHELGERGFSVTVVEAMPALPGAGPNEVQVGGIARSQYRVPVPYAGGHGYKKPVPGEHGYRFFPSFYRHVFDTMKRTVIHTNPPAGELPVPTPPHTAFKQLIPTLQQVFAKRRGYTPLDRTRPRSLENFRLEYMKLVEDLGFSRRDIGRFFFKLVRYMMTCPERRAAEYEDQTFIDFLGGPEFYSEKMVAAIRDAPRALAAMDADHCDARTQGSVYLQLLMDQILGGEYVDGTLCGPTSEAWFEPWRAFLGNTYNVDFYRAELRSIRAHSDDSDASHASPALSLTLKLPAAMEKLDREDLLRRIENSRYVVMAVDPVSAERVTAGWAARGGVPHELRRFASYVRRGVEAKRYRYELAFVFREAPEVTEQEAETALRNLLRQLEVGPDDASPNPVLSVLRSIEGTTGRVLMHGRRAAELRVSMWFRQRIGPGRIQAVERTLMRWVAGSKIDDVRLMSDQPDWFDAPQVVHTPRHPEARYGDHPSDRFQTLTGIQYYFDQNFSLIRGHVYFPDTEWGLTAISQSQFWTSAMGEREFKGVLSVDIGECARPSTYLGKNVMDCNPQEIAEEVWRQIEDSLRTTRGAVATVTSLPLPQPLAYHLDANLSFVGGKLASNASPFLVNNAGDWKHRPRCMPWVPDTTQPVDAPRTDGPDIWQAPHGGYRVHAGRVVFCGHYMRTFTRMTTMEAANESARHAVNAILDHLVHASGSPGTAMSGDYCKIWNLENYEIDDLAYFKRVDKWLFDRGKAHVADYLQLDRIADVVHPEMNGIQALVAAMASTAADDWGMDAAQAAAAPNLLPPLARVLSEALRQSGTAKAPPTLGDLRSFAKEIGDALKSAGRS